MASLAALGALVIVALTVLGAMSALKFLANPKNKGKNRK